MVLILAKSAFAFQQADKRTELITKQSQKLAKSIEGESLKETLSIFDVEATLMPEYHMSIRGNSKVRAYYMQFFEKTNTSKFTKEPFEIVDLKNHFIELGTYTHEYSTPKEKDFEYVGKYMTYWKFNGNGVPKIMAHVWGGSSYTAPENFNFVSIDVLGLEPIKVNTQWKKDIEEARKFSHKAVFSGDTKTQLKSYADDAIYMTYYDPPFIGKEKITEYFNVHNNGRVPMDSLMTKIVKVIDMGNHALKFGEYYVEWTWEGKPSYIKGKGLTLYKRMQEGTIKIYRQMINHSMPASTKE